MSTVKIGFLNLPDPPEELKNKLIDICKKITVSEDSRRWIDDFHHNELDVAALEYGNNNTEITREIQDEIRSIYGKFFSGDLLRGDVGKIKNVLPVPGQLPPHCDRLRQTAINYLLELGGPDVQTVFYKECRRNPDLSMAESTYYKDLTVDFKIKFPQHKWHAYSVQQYHAVENVVTERYLFSLILKSNPTFTDFITEHNDLLDHSSPILDRPLFNITNLYV